MRYYLELPTIPPGHDFAKDTFWYRYRERFARRRANGWHIRESDYDWYDREEARAALAGEQFPPEPIYQRAARPVPQPWTGREEKVRV